MVKPVARYRTGNNDYIELELLQVEPERMREYRLTPITAVPMFWAEVDGGVVIWPDPNDRCEVDYGESSKGS